MASLANSRFSDAFSLVVGIEGGYSTDPDDPGNWTGGAKGRGDLKGTKYGISAASYPHLDIANLSIGDARGIYKFNYWDRVHGDELPPALALCVFDAAINEGVKQATRQLQAALGVHSDGSLGPATMQAVKEHSAQDVVVKFLGAQLHFKAHIKGWEKYGEGWADREVKIAFKAGQLLQMS